MDLKKYEEICVIITHLHNDHAGSLSQFILYNWFINKKKTTVISKCDKIKEYLEITGTTKEAYEVTSKYQDVEFIKTEHVKELDSYGFKININGKNIVYTGDTATLEPFRKYLDNCYEFYVDVSKFGGVHLKFEDVIGELKKVKDKETKVFLMHIDDSKYISELNKNEFYI